MKYLLSVLTLFSIVLFNPVYAEKETANNSFGDKSYKYKSQYKKNNNELRKKIRNLNAAKSKENYGPESRKPDSSEEKSKDGRYLGH